MNSQQGKELKQLFFHRIPWTGLWANLFNLVPNSRGAENFQISIICLDSNLTLISSWVQRFFQLGNKLNFHPRKLIFTRLTWFTAILRKRFRRRLTSLWQLKTKLMNKEIRWAFYHHDIYFTSIILPQEKRNTTALFSKEYLQGKGNAETVCEVT